VAVVIEVLAATWENVTLGEAVGGTVLAGGGAGLVVVARWVVRALQASTRALEAVTKHMEASTAAARAIARFAALTPLAAEAMRCSIRAANGKVPAIDDDSDELRVLRVAAEGDDLALARAAAQLADLEPGATLPTQLARVVRRMVELEREAQRQRGAREVDAPKRRGAKV
jgi:hypothetical protein